MRREGSRADLSPDDRAWVEEVGRALEPPPMDADRARAFRLAIDARLEPPARARGLRAFRAGGAFALAATAGLALGAWIEWAPVENASIGSSRPAAIADAAATAEATTRIAWVELDDSEPRFPEESLPGDYLALASFVAGE